MDSYSKCAKSNFKKSKVLLFCRYRALCLFNSQILTYRILYVTIKKKEKCIMLAINYTNLRDNMKNCMDKVTDDYETIIVTRKNNKNVVMISEAAYNNLMENIHVMGNKANYDWLMQSKRQLEQGLSGSHELVEVTADE